MKYYTIDWDYDNLEVIGYYPQTALKKGYNPSLPESYTNVSPHNFPNFVPNLELEIHNKAIATDYIQKHVNFGMIINQKFKNIIEKFKLPPHAFYPVKVYHKGEVLKYYWFHYIVDDFLNWLDTNNSKAIIYDDKEEYKVISEVDLKLTLSEIQKINIELPWHQHMKWEKITFKSNFPKYDVYKTQGLDLKNVISENLLFSLLDSKANGFEAKLFDKIVCN
ncbi:conserved hypothetical protein [Tenacibaculum sp. 190524A02b]|uniref:Uncharacterized protein n=1 Tax=Tenacibaculum vairaonense TaxID=3137860 RepID=A0ABM9PN52_9FLAO